MGERGRGGGSGRGPAAGGRAWDGGAAAVPLAGGVGARAGRLEALAGLVAPGGDIAIAPRPRCPGARASPSRGAADEVENLLRSGGFTQMSPQTPPLSPPVICVLADAPGPDTKRTPQP